MNVSVFFQSLKQMGGIIALEHRYHGNLPDIRNCRLCAEYSLPFKGKWVVVNGGISKEHPTPGIFPPRDTLMTLSYLTQKAKAFTDRRQTHPLFIAMERTFLLRLMA